MSSNDTATTGTLQRVLAYIIAALVILSLVCFGISLAGYFAGVFVNEATDGLWPTIIMLPLIALPAAFVLTFVLIIVTVTRRSRSNRG